MTAQPTRGIVRLVIAIIIAAVIISAAVLSYPSFESTVTRTTTEVTTSTVTITSDVPTTSTTTCSSGTQVSYSADRAQSLTTDCSIWLTLDIGTDSAVPAGQNETVSISLINDLPMARNITYSSTPTALPGINFSDFQIIDYILPLEYIGCGSVSPTGASVPAYMVMYNSSGMPLQLSDLSTFTIACDQPLPIVNDYDHFNASETQAETLSIGGYWTSQNVSQPWVNAVYHQFSPGRYTVLVYDAWNQTTELSFTVYK